VFGISGRKSRAPSHTLQLSGWRDPLVLGRTMVELPSKSALSFGDIQSPSKPIELPVDRRLRLLKEVEVVPNSRESPLASSSVPRHLPSEAEERERVAWKRNNFSFDWRVYVTGSLMEAPRVSYIRRLILQDRLQSPGCWIGSRKQTCKRRPFVVRLRNKRLKFTLTTRGETANRIHRNRSLGMPSRGGSERGRTTLIG